MNRNTTELRWLSRFTLGLLIGVTAVALVVLVLSLRDAALLAEHNRALLTDLDNQNDVIECLVVGIAQAGAPTPQEVLEACESEFRP